MGPLVAFLIAVALQRGTGARNSDFLEKADLI